MKSSKPVGAITRGTTHPNRLRRSDRWILHQVCPVIRAAADPLFVDLGYGATPTTTIELYERLAKHVRSDVEVIGIEIDPARVAQAEVLARPGVSFTHGGFEVPLAHARQPIAIRAFNVLRQYDEAQVVSAWSTMADRLAPNGYLIEGTCDEIGRRSTWLSIRAGASSPETLTISAHIDSLELPSDIAPRLPKALIHHNVAGEPIHEFLSAMDRAWLSHAALIPFGARQRWVATVQSLADEGLPIHDTKVRWRLGEITVPWSLVKPTSYPG